MVKVGGGITKIALFTDIGSPCTIYSSQIILIGLVACDITVHPLAQPSVVKLKGSVAAQFDSIHSVEKANGYQCKIAVFLLN